MCFERYYLKNQQSCQSELVEDRATMYELFNYHSTDFDRAADRKLNLTTS